MLKNYLKIALRNLARYRVYSFINILSLAVGIAACLLIFLFITNERSFDAFHNKKEQIYRLNEIQSFEGITPQHVALSMYPMGPTLKDEFPEIQTFTRFVNAGTLLERGETTIFVDNAFWTDSSFFDVFDFPLIQGDPSTALHEPGRMLVTEETARRLFGNENPIGQTIVVNDRTLEITGVLADVPDASHLQFDAVSSLSTIENEDMLNNWGSNWLVTYLLLREGTDPAALEAKFRAYQEKYMQEGATEYYELYLQALTDIHLGSTHITHDYHNWKKFDGKYIFTFSILALFVLVIAGINFMNLSTARSARRSREVGIRKAVGALRYQLARQFVGESVVFAYIALVLALLIALVVLPLLNTITHRALSFAILTDPMVALLVTGITLVVGLLSGLYPAFFMASFRPIQALKGPGYRQGSKTPLRNVLIITQFAIAIGLIVGTTLAVQQLDFMKSQDAGFDRAQVVLLPMSPEANDAYDTLKDELLKHPHVRDVTGSVQRLGNNIHQNGMRAEGPTEVVRLAPSHLSVDYNYLSFYGLDLVAGREFSEAFSTDRGSAYIINESMAEEIGWKDPLGKRMGVSWEDSLGTVIGVVKDFNFNSLHHKIQPIALSVQGWGFSEMSVRVDEADMNQTLQDIEEIWNTHVTDRPFRSSFLDDHFTQLYASDQQVSRVVGAIALLAIVIACLGLFGLALFTTQERTKEIGIRKALGASIPGLVYLLTKRFTQLVLIAFALAVPVTYVLMDSWLQNFAYHIDVDVAVFLFAGVLSLLIAFVTVSYHAITTARANPVKALRYE